MPHNPTIRYPQVAAALVPLLVLFVHGCPYNLVGTVAAARGIDYGPLVAGPLDSMVPLVPVFVLPYLFVWVFPLLLVGCAVFERGSDPALFLRLSLSLLALMVVNYVLWIAFPVSVNLRVDVAVLANHGWLGQLVGFNYERATPWNSCPSFHVAAPWFLCRALPPIGRLPRWFFWSATAAIIASTVLIRIHYLIDIPCGIVVAELVHQLVHRRLGRS